MDLIAAADRWVLYTAALLAGGSALFLVFMTLPVVVADAARRIGRPAAYVTAAAYILAIGFGGADMIGGGPGIIFTAQAWTLGLHTTLSTSAMIGVPGALLLLIAFARPSKALLIGGVLLTLGGFLVTGHAATAPPSGVMAAVVGLHLVSVAFWLGALGPLFVAARVLPAAETGALLMRFSTRAIIAVSGLVVTGALIGCIQTGSLAAMINTDYGLRLLVKLGLVALLVSLADYNKVILTPKLARGDATATTPLRRTITAEIVLFLLILLAAVSLTTTAPPRTLDAMPPGDIAI